MQFTLFKTCAHVDFCPVSQRRRVVAISLDHLCSLDHISPENCRSALAAASLLNAMTSSIAASRQVEGEEEEEEDAGLDASQKTTLERIHSEISNFELEGQGKEFKRLLENLRDKLVSLLTPN